MQETRLRLLQEMPIFGGVTQATLNFLLEFAPLVPVASNGYYFQQGDQADSVFVLEEGKVAVIKTWQGEACVLKTLEKGDCFGEMALMDLLPRSASVMAIEPSRAIQISAAMLYQLYTQDIEQFVIIQMNMAREVSRRLRAADDRLFEERFRNKSGESYGFYSV